MPGALSVREVPPAAWETAAAFLDRVFLEEFDTPVGQALAADLARLREGGEGLHGHVVLAETGRHLIGAAVLLCETVPRPATTFLWWAVDSPARRHGVARRLLSDALKICPSEGPLSVQARSLAASPAAPRLLWSLGFRVVDVVPVTLGVQEREMLLFEGLALP